MKKKVLDTRFLVLCEVARSQPHTKQINIAKELDLTPQAVSDHIKELGQQRLINNKPNEVYLTKKGVQYLINSLESIKDYVKEIDEEVIEVAPSKALAIEKINKGDKVNLFMKKGVLRASKSIEKGKATGIANNSASKNEEVKIKKIRGIIDLKKGFVEIIFVPPPEEGGASSINDLKLDNHKKDRTFTLGTGSIALGKKLDLDIDSYFPTIDSIINSVIRGLDCLIICDEENKEELLTELNKNQIEYKTIEKEQE